MTPLLAIGGLSEVPHLLTFFRKLFVNQKWQNFIYEWENIFFSFLVAVLLSIFFYLGSKDKEWIPSGFQNFLESLVEIFESFVVGIIGEDGKRFIPFLGTLFIYVLSMNLLGLIPFMKSPSSNLNIALGLSLCVFGLVQYLNIKHMGFKGFLFHLAGSPKNITGWLIAPLMFPIEVITQISRPITLALRLFGNILGEKALVGFFTVLSVAVLYFFPIQTPFMLFGLITSVMQAMVFTMLSTIYIFLALQHSADSH